MSEATQDAQAPDLYVMPVSDEWLPQFVRTVATPFDFGSDRPPALNGFTVQRIWGTQTGERDERTFRSLSKGDVVVFYHGETVFAYGRVDQTLESAAAGEYIWDDRESRYIYTMDEYHTLALPQDRLWDDLEYSPEFTIRGFKRVKPERTDSLRSDVGSLSAYLGQYHSNQSVNELVGVGLGANDDATSSDGDDVTAADQSEYWNLVEGKRDTAAAFRDGPSEETLAAFLEDFWTLRAAPSVEWYLENQVLSDRTAEEVATALEDAITAGRIDPAVAIHGFGVSVASEALRALAPEDFPILNEPAVEGMRALGYEPPNPTDASPEDYPAFADSVDAAIERYDLRQLATDAADVVVPSWATDLQVADHLFYRHSNDDYDFQFETWLPCESTVESAPYYWVNQSAPSDGESVTIEKSPTREFDTEVGRLSSGDTVFHQDGGDIVGYSTVNDEPTTVTVGTETRCRVTASFTAFDEPVPFSQVFGYLISDKDDTDEYYPVDDSGLRNGYLYNLSAAAGNWLLEQANSQPPDESQLQRLKDRLSQPKFTVELPSELYFHERERPRLEQQINAALNSGKHIIFTGPPGTGKSKLARAVAEQAAEHHEAVDGHVFTTATAEWTTFDTIGGYVPDESGDGLVFDPRLFLQCFRDDDGTVQNKWLVVDELNRANIDKALGPLFSVLAEDSVELPYERERRIRVDWLGADAAVNEDRVAEIAGDPDRFPVTPSWWLIGTMNTVDKTSLYDLSFAFMRRFNFVHVGVPDLTVEIDGEDVVSRALLDPEAAGQNYATTWQREQPELAETIADYHEEVAIVWAIFNEYRPIGPAIVLDIFQHIAAHEGGDEKTQLTSAILSLVLPQMEGLRERDQSNLLDDLEAGLAIQAAGGETAKTVDLRIDFDYLRRKAADTFDLDTTSSV